ncbi:relaxase/mobilization nuclease domain-containing protein [Pontibacter qinzhouensis]|uniref:Relaxase/mobilization nuclease domain-containing protein n=1 Tax=Pontibacter qinzhouensis TaxID=2603253 RepID=A0A5C8JLF4_9BACT|nr:relaxase/mobilization nuclease domain-containing protein [Pontibacter qinzhouensis]TXK37693.1 relaxase/mobilization nuclease domain-containing protein [Pontibacter qinzhouensis]
MVARIITGKSIRGALHYNEHKVREGQAELIFASRFLQEPEELSFKDKLGRFGRLLEKSPQVKTNTLHISLNFAFGEQLEEERLQVIALRYMDMIGFGEQPYLVYRHHDAAHPHLHIVTTNIRSDGSRIDLHNIGRLRSEPARQALELEYGLVQAERMKKEEALPLEPLQLEKALYGKSETRRSIARIVSTVTRHYNYTSLAELNAVLRHFGVMADRGREGTQMHRNKGLSYSIVNGKGEKQGVPLKASTLPGKPTLAYLEKQFERNELSRRPLQLSLRTGIDKLFHSQPRMSREDFVKRLAREHVHVVFRENSQGITYGVTYIDHRHKAVFNGSELGKAYSAKAITECFSQNAARTEQVGNTRQEVSRQQGTAGTARLAGQHEQEAARLNNSDAPGLLEALLKAEHQNHLPEPLRGKRKKRRRKPRL